MHLSPPQRWRTIGTYLCEGALHPLQTGTWFPPQDEFFDLLCDEMTVMNGRVRNVVDIGTAAALLPIALLQRGMPSGTCAAVDCNPRFLRTAQKNLADTRLPEHVKNRVKLVEGKAQDIRSIVGSVLNGEGIDCAVLSFSVKNVGVDTTRRIMQDMVPHLNPGAQVMLYNVFSTTELMRSVFRHVRTRKIRDANYFLFPVEFELNIGEDPWSPEEYRQRSTRAPSPV